MSTQKGFGLLGLLIVTAIIALLVFGGGFYTNSLKQKQSTIQRGLEAEKRAEQLKHQLEQQNAEQLKIK